MKKLDDLDMNMRSQIKKNEIITTQQEAIEKALNVKID